MSDQDRDPRDRHATKADREAWERRRQERERAPKPPKPLPHPASLRFDHWRNVLLERYWSSAKLAGFNSWYAWWCDKNRRAGFPEEIDRWPQGDAVDAGEELPSTDHGSIGQALSAGIPTEARGGPKRTQESTKAEELAW